MASFDIIDSAGKSYRLAWEERYYLMRRAALPLFIKAVCYMAMVHLGWEQSYLKHALIMLPSYFADGWLLALVVRLIFLQEYYPPAVPDNGESQDDSQKKALQAMASGVMRGMVMFVAIRFFLAGSVAFTYQLSERYQETLQADMIHPGWYVLSFALFFIMIWAFRFLWLYIPAALNYPVRDFLRDIRGVMSSLYMIGVWLVCMAPLLFFFAIIAAVVIGFFGGESGQAAPLPVYLMLALLHVTFDTIINILTTAGIAFGLISAAQNRP